MLNSAAVVTLPSPIAPPIRTMRPMRSAASGYRAGSSATFVSGPSGTSVTRSTRRRRQPGDVVPHVGAVRARRPREGELTHERPVGARSDGNLAGQELH